MPWSTCGRTRSGSCRCAEAYVLRGQNIALRPPVTYAEQVRVMRNVTITRDITVVDHRNMAMPLHELAADPIAGRNLRMVRVSEAERQQIRRQVAAVHQMREQRAQQEREAARGGLANQPRKMSLPHSPIAAHPAARPAGHPGGHPAAHGAPRVPARPSPIGSRGRGTRGRGRSPARPRAVGPCPRAGPPVRPPAGVPRRAGRPHDPGPASRPGREPPRADATDPPRRGSGVLSEGGIASTAPDQSEPLGAGPASAGSAPTTSGVPTYRPECQLRSAI